MENLGITVSDRHKDDELAYKQFKSTISYDSEKAQFSVGFPWRNGQPPKKLSENRFVGLSTFQSMMKWLDRDLIKGKNVLSAKNVLTAKEIFNRKKSF